MDLIVAVLLGLAAAFVGSMPIAGPIAVLVVDRALGGARREAAFVAIGAGFGESLYALGVALFWPILAGEWKALVPVSRGVGALVICTVGFVLLLKPNVIHTAKTPRKRASLLTGVALTVFNPTLLASWAVVTSALYAEGWLARARPAAVLYGVGAAAGVVGWFGLLIYFSDWAKKYVEGFGRQRINRAFGVVLIGASAYLGVRTFSDSRSGDRAGQNAGAGRYSDFSVSSGASVSGESGRIQRSVGA